MSPVFHTAVLAPKPATPVGGGTATRAAGLLLERTREQSQTLGVQRMLGGERIRARLSGGVHQPALTDPSCPFAARALVNDGPFARLRLESRSSATRCAGECSARPTNPSPSGRAICSESPKVPQQTMAGGCPLAPSPHSPTTPELTERAKSPISKSSLAPLTAFSADTHRFVGIPVVVQLGRCVSATRPGLSTRSPVRDQVMTHSPSSRHDPRSQIAPEARRRQGEARGSCETLRLDQAFAGPALELLEWGRTLLLQHPHMPPSAAASALSCSALMVGCPARGPRS
jgi:hypothetical protein